jgi:hypothetical protein
MQKGKRPGGAASLEGRGAINLLVRAQAAGAWSWHQKAARERSPQDFPILDSSRAKRSVKTETPMSTFGNNLKSVASIADSGQVPTFPSLLTPGQCCRASLLLLPEHQRNQVGRQASPNTQDIVIFEKNAAVVPTERCHAKGILAVRRGPVGKARAAPLSRGTKFY